MAGSPGARAPIGATFQERLRPGRRWLAAIAPLLLLLVLVTWRAGSPGRPVAFSLSGAAENLAPTALLGTAADQMEARTAKGGAGYTFTIVQRTSIDARPGGPLVEIPDPADRHATLGKTDHYELATYLERGAAAPGGFWLEIRDGPSAGEAPDFEKARYELGAIVLGGTTYRNDGDGWYPTDAPPGIGLDPRTASLLPAMLRGATNAKTADASIPLVAGTSVALQADGRVADMPGIIAVDAESFTELVKPLELLFDDQGRLVSIHAVARNTRLDGYDMIVDTTIAFSYPLLGPDIPKPDPIIDPESIAKGEG